MTRRLVSGLAAALAVLACLAGCRRAGTQSAAPGGTSDAAPRTAAAASAVTSQGSEPLTIARFLGYGCALDDGGLAWCWSPPTGLLTDREGDAVPRRIPELDGASAFEKTTNYSYILRDGRVFVWGKDTHSYLGDVSKPKLMPALKDVTEIAARGDLCSALQRDAELWWWNDGFVSAEAGEPGVAHSNPPARIATGVRSLARPFQNHFIAQSGKVYGGRMGKNTEVEGVHDPRSVTQCGSLACAILDPKRVECWEERNGSKPFELKGSGDFVSLQCAGGGDIFALLADGGVWVAQHSIGRPHELRRLPTLERVAELGLGGGSLAYPHCLKLQGGSVSCWGTGDSRLLGSGTWPDDPRFTPLVKGRDVTTPRRP